MSADVSRRSFLTRRYEPSDAALLVAVTALALAVRLPLILANPFPLGDGGLFYQMVQDLRASFPVLPATTGYNHADIPFVYPPLAFYLAAALGNGFGASTYELLRFIPVAFSVLSVPALYLLARRVLGSTAHATFAAAAFAVLPRSYDWLIDGGGLTRAPGVVLALLTLWAWLGGFESRRLRDWAIAGIGLGVTVLLHPQAAIFSAVSMAVLLVFRGRAAWSPVRLGVAAFCAIAVVLPWIVGLLAIHGWAGITAIGSAGQRWEPLLGIASLVDFDVSGTLYYAGPVMLGFAGLVTCLLKGRYLLPAWIAAVFLVGAGGGNFLAMPVVALLIAAFIVDTLGSISPETSRSAARWRVTLALAGLLAIALASGTAAASAKDLRITGLSTYQRAAMAWVADSTPAAARFVVVEPAIWGLVGEWFPVLAGRESVNTLQGFEWLGRDRFAARGALDTDIAGCVSKGGGCLQEVLQRQDLGDAYLYVPKDTGSSGGDCCLAVRQELIQSPLYRVILDDPGATVLAPEPSG